MIDHARALLSCTPQGYFAPDLVALHTVTLRRTARYVCDPRHSGA